MSIQANKDDVLKTLKKNRENHLKILKEARQGYLESALKALAKKTETLKNGKIENLNFNLEPPSDYSKVYDTTIQMLEMHTENKITLSSDQVRCLIQDEWDWTQMFLRNASNYSSIAASDYINHSNVIDY